MDVQPAQAPLLRTTWPDFAAELVAALDACGEAGLKEQIEQLRIVEVCSCNDDFCQSFRTAPKLPGPYGDGHRNVCLDAPWPGYLILDVLHDDIVYVEVLYRTPLS
ncbi:hypothetical protein [Dactylosporangium sp. NPDC048998]|uniref:hypothetical protein n=1 Tax=Dactylosporangium sp. NPDC048998 TaxID=3363976 RepID=UPI00371A2CC1